ncbi:MAG TPA: lysophospholipid acyltransferase family protein, partial [Verrucomicrobiae bacterium]|nr:lysophospholipid acyltransferase family protein [Verrucomicrobiae bacterium]
MLLSAILRHPLRIIGRSLWLGWEFLVATLDYYWNVTFRRPNSLRTARALWLQRSSRRVLRVVKLVWQASGPIPKRGLLISNHLSYLDVLVLAAITPAVFVSKREVKNWPVFGWFARLAGTLFVNREKRSEVSRSKTEIEQALGDGA